ncbi:MAG: murein hydrolase activator EnvC family protein, partial [Alphaproteobacteria bacterium]
APPPAQSPQASVPVAPPIDARPQPRTGRFLWPVRGEVVSAFGAKAGGLQNDGINIAAGLGTPVRAAENGVVVYAGNELKGFGNLVLLRHADGWMSAYAHLDEIGVERGAQVQRGQGIGKVGQSGGVSSPQLHFELRRDGRPVDPRPHLAGG